MENDYMQQVAKEAADVEVALRRKAAVNAPNQAPRPPSPASPPMVQAAGAPRAFSSFQADTRVDEGGGPAGSTQLGVRITGWWPFQSVVVPPNVYVVHTRRGHEKPVNIGLGLSFRYNPYTDSFLVVPSSLQTILISANSICHELQGILIQAYVQWIIQDIEIAYQRLDFSNMEDPMSVVNVQLREQAQAAIKDKVATMAIKDVLSDKQPIIEELTRRLKLVAEGSSGDKGLGIRIVTVQIKEAVVSSRSLWENLQKPFRATQSAVARLAEIEEQSRIGKRELEEREQHETAELNTESELARLRAEKEAAGYDREQQEALRRVKLESEAERQRIEAAAAIARQKRESDEREKQHALELEHKLRHSERDRALGESKHQVQVALERYQVEATELAARLTKELAAKDAGWKLQEKDLGEKARLDALALEAKLAAARLENEARNAQTGHEIGFEAERRKVANQVSAELVQLEAVKLLPQLAHALPKPDRLETVTIGDGGTASFPGLVASLLSILRSYGIAGPARDGEPAPPARPAS